MMKYLIDTNILISDLVNNGAKSSFFLDSCYWLFTDLNVSKGTELVY